MKYVKHDHYHWRIVTPENEDEEYLKYHGIFKLVEHEIPEHDTTKFKISQYVYLQAPFRTVHKFNRVIPIDADEPDRPDIIDPEDNTNNS